MVSSFESLERQLAEEEKVESRSFAFTSNPEEVLEEIIRQFPTPEKCFRELVQNAIDAETDKVVIDYKHENGVLTMWVEDYGIGMDSKSRDEYLLKIFASDKEHDMRKIGKFGIGFKSVFAIQPDQVIVESGGHGDGWKLFIDMEYKARIYRSKGRDGTKVTMIKRMDQGDARDLIKLGREEVKASCGYSKTPIFFGGKKTNKDFDLDEKIKLKFEEEGIEGVIVITDHSNYKVLNNYFLVKEDYELIGPTDFGYSVLVNSPYFRLNLSRNDVIKDACYERMLSIVSKNVKKLFSLVFERLEAGDNSEELWEFASNYISRKIQKNEDHMDRALSREIMDARLFKTVYDEKLSLRDILAEYKKEKKIYLAAKTSRVTDFLREKNKVVLKPVNEHVRRILGSIRYPIDVNEEYYVPQILKEDKIGEREKRFLELMRSGLRKAGMEYELEWGEYYPEERIGEDKPFYLLPFERNRLVINRKNEHIKNLIDLSTADHQTAEYLAVQSVVYSVADKSSKQTLKLLRKFIKRWEYG